MLLTKRNLVNATKKYFIGRGMSPVSRELLWHASSIEQQIVSRASISPDAKYPTVNARTLGSYFSRCVIRQDETKAARGREEKKEKTDATRERERERARLHMPISEAIISVKWIRQTRERSTGRLYTDREPHRLPMSILLFLLPRVPTCYCSDCFFALTAYWHIFVALFIALSRSQPALPSRLSWCVCAQMARRNYLDRMMPRRSLGGFYTSSLSSLNDGGAYSSAIRRTVRTSLSWYVTLRSCCCYEEIKSTTSLFSLSVLIIVFGISSWDLWSCCSFVKNGNLWMIEIVMVFNVLFVSLLLFSFPIESSWNTRKQIDKTDDSGRCSVIC